MKIGLITYNRPHAKTYSIASRLFLEESDVTLLFVPWKDHSPRHPLMIHRPQQSYGPDPNLYAKRFGWKVQHFDKAKNIDLFVVGGCQFIQNLKALNSHPGYLPYVRGLDALKWAIYNGLPIGVSVHWTSNKLDGGRIVYRKFVPLYFEDTFHSLAYRLYVEEIDALLTVIRSPDLWDNEITETDKIPDIVHSRMPQYRERIMLEKFETRRRNSPSIYDHIKT